jgi:hypothetical protein
MSGSLFPEFFAQCCDAGDYIGLGIQCATENICYGDVRPGGAYYWFSWPVRLGLSNEALIFANLLLLVVSSLLSSRLLLLICKVTISFSFSPSGLSKTATIIASLLIHLFFFWPTIFTSLSDPPSSLLLLNGLWLLLFSCLLSGFRQPLLLIFSCLLLGWAAWIRAFYFYPVLVGIIAGCIAILVSPRRKYWHVLLLFALIPPGCQFANTYQQSGALAYLNSGSSNSWTKTHLTSSVVGYDTVFQNQGYYFMAQHCTVNAGLLPSLQQGDYSSLFCLMSNRAAFYLATYRPINYIYPHIKNQLFTTTIENVGDESFWLRQNLDRQADVALDPHGGMTADKMIAQSASPTGGTYIAQWVALPGNTDYTFSVWLWSDKPTSIPLTLTRHSDDKLVASTNAAVTRQPQRFSVSGKTLKFDEYSVIIGTLPSTTDVSFGSSPTDSFYAWGAQLEEGSSMTEYAGIEPLVGSDIRRWYPWLLAANVMVMALALLFVIRSWKILLLEPAGLAATATVGAVFAEALVIIPEQRFCIAFMVVIWLFALGFILLTMASPSRSPISVNS